MVITLCLSILLAAPMNTEFPPRFHDAKATTVRKKRKSNDEGAPLPFQILFRPRVKIVVDNTRLRWYCHIFDKFYRTLKPHLRASNFSNKPKLRHDFTLFQMILMDRDRYGLFNDII